MKVDEYHRRLESPRYMYAVRMAQSMLEDYAREAGARSFDMRMPEKVNRRLTDTAPTCSSRFKSCVLGS